MGIAWLMLNLGRWARSFRLFSARVLIVWQKALQSVVDNVLLLLQDAEVMVDHTVNVVKIGGSYLCVCPSEQQFVLFVL